MNGKFLAKTGALQVLYISKMTILQLHAVGWVASLSISCPVELSNLQLIVRSISSCIARNKPIFLLGCGITYADILINGSFKLLLMGSHTCLGPFESS